MTTFIAFPDLHDKAERLKDIRHIMIDADAILLPGDMTNGSSENLNRTLNIIEAANENILAVCGNMDTEKMNMRMARAGISIHRKHQMLDGIAIMGCGGALPFAGRYVFSEEQLAQFLEEAYAGIQPTTPTILVCHQPPYGTKVDDLGGSQHVGSHAVREFIERVQPLVCLCGHVHEGTGIDQIGETLLINPGPIWRTDAYAYLEIEAGQVITAEIRAAQKLEL